ncbi:cupin domain-containing protein [Puia sp.]|uniref:cupin domain-containing protein n=1 Tax=Puia sp. TaxID=2045100 RepID=UPI002F425992
MLEKTDFALLATATTESYLNTTLSNVNDHVVKMSVMTSPYPWHSHPNSDETFIGVEGIVIIETKEQTMELTPGSSITIPKNMIHRTSPKGARSVNLTIEKVDIQTKFA